MKRNYSITVDIYDQFLPCTLNPRGMKRWHGCDWGSRQGRLFVTIIIYCWTLSIHFGRA